MPGCLAQLALPSLPLLTLLLLAQPPSAFPGSALPFQFFPPLPLPLLSFVSPIVFLALPPSPTTTLVGPPESPFLSELYLKISFSGKPSLETQTRAPDSPL